MEPPKKRKFLGDEDVYSSSNAVVRNGGAYAGVGLESAATVRGGARRTMTDNSTTTSTIISSNNIGTSKVPVQSYVCNSTLPQQKQESNNIHFSQDSFKSDGEEHDIVASTDANSSTPARRNRRKYSVEFKVSVLEGYYTDPETRGNQRKTAIKYGVNRRQIQKWLAQESQLREQRDSCEKNLCENGKFVSGQNKPCQTSPPVTITPLPSPHKFTNSELIKINPENFHPTNQVTSYDTKNSSRINGHYFSNSQSQNPISPATITLKTPENPYKRKSQEGKHIMAELPPSRPATLTACTVASTRMMSPTTIARSVSDIKTSAAEMRILPRTFSSPTSELYQRVEIKVEAGVDNTVLSGTEEPINLSRDNHHSKTVTDQKSTMARSHPDPLSTHILDTGTGKPAADVQVHIYRMGGGSNDNPNWMKVNSKRTNEDGRASGFLTWESFYPGTYKLHFSTAEMPRIGSHARSFKNSFLYAINVLGEYFAKSNTSTFYPYAEIVFQISDPTSHYHVPLLLSPYAYSTYRGS